MLRRIVAQSALDAAAWMSAADLPKENFEAMASEAYRDALEVGKD